MNLTYQNPINLLTYTFYRLVLLFNGQYVRLLSGDFWTVSNVNSGRLVIIFISCINI